MTILKPKDSMEDIVGNIKFSTQEESLRLKPARYYLAMLQQQLEEVEGCLDRWGCEYTPTHKDFVKAQKALSFKRSDKDSGLRESADSNLNRLNRALGILVTGVKPKTSKKRKTRARR
jgi:hypothetical protein